MNLVETYDLLRQIAAVDNRQVDDATVAMWQAILADDLPADCTAAVIAHFRDETAYLTPSHVHAGARAAVAEREREALREQVQRRLARLGPRDEAPRVITSGEDRSPEVLKLIQSVTDSLPQMDSHARAVARAQRERGRAEKPPVRERKRHTKPMKFPPPADDAVAALATRYLVDGYTPADVSARLGISYRWCEKTAARVAGRAT